MLRLNILLITSLLVFVAGCSLYDTKEDKQGRTIRVNKVTGEVSIIDGDKLVKVKSEKEVIQEKSKDDALSTTVKWDDSTFLNNIPVSFMSKWADSMMSYKLIIKNNIRPKSNYYSRINIELKDKEGFKILDIPIPVNTLTGNLGEDNKTIVQMELSDRVSLSKDDYKRIGSWGLTWSGFK